MANSIFLAHGWCPGDNIPFLREVQMNGVAYCFFQHGNHTKQANFWCFLVKLGKVHAPEAYQEVRGMYAWLEACICSTEIQTASGEPWCNGPVSLCSYSVA